MGRILIGAVAAAIAMFIIGFIFFGSGLQGLASHSLDDQQAAAVQQSLAMNLPETGTYTLPDPNKSNEQTVMYGRGPVATIHYNMKGFAATDSGSLIAGFILDIVTALLIGLALLGIGERAPDFGSRARLVVLFALGAAAYMHLGEPIWYHHDWTHFIYLFVADAAALIAAGLIIARWFLPKSA